ncbi:MAG TPA: hypothetical protein VGG39_00585 [Polyangiaceae bacterium]|jgi:hypothetical protein
MKAEAANRLGRWSVAGLLALALVSASAGATAQSDTAPPTVDQCFTAAERAQPLMKQRKLREAQRYLQTCAREECPRAARKDCKAWLDDVSAAVPTVVFVAREERASGASVAIEDVRVSVDGEVAVASRIDGAVPIDPGVHTLRFEHPGFEPVEQRIDVREGERDRQVDVVFRAAPARAPAPSSTEPPPVGNEEPPSHAIPAEPTSVPALAWGLGAGAVVAFGVGLTMEAIGLSARSHLANTCQPDRSCSASDVDSARTRVAVGDVALGVGALLFAGAAYVYFTNEPSRSTRAVHLRVGPMVGGVGAGIEGAL